MLIPRLVFRGTWKLPETIAVLTPHPGPLPVEGLIMSHIFLAGHRGYERNGRNSEHFARPEPARSAEPCPPRRHGDCEERNIGGVFPAPTVSGEKDMGKDQVRGEGEDRRAAAEIGLTLFPRDQEV